MEGKILIHVIAVYVMSVYFMVLFGVGAKQSGAKGFFKGVGKGLIGVIAKPVGGVVDLASNTFEGIKG